VVVSSLESASELKARGAFYTPASVTTFLARWGIRSPTDRVLEPASGDGAFLGAVAERLRALGAPSLRDLVAVELHPLEAEKSAAMAPGATIHTGSFFDLAPKDLGEFSVVVGNPPYIRYHGFRGAERATALKRASEAGVELSGLASSWAHFVAHAASFLPPREGRLALVLPAELLTTDYADPVRRFLQTRFASIALIAFDGLVFDGAQVDAVLLLASNDDADGLRVIRVKSADALWDLDVFAHVSDGAPQTGRWTGLIDRDVDALYTSLKTSERWQALGDMASVDIGLVTGANHYFMMTRQEARERGIPRTVLTDVLERPRDARGLLLTRSETRLMLDIPLKHRALGVGVMRFIREGEEAGVDRGFKTRSRRLWYSVPRPRNLPDAFLPYMSHHSPRLILNTRRAWSTNLVHGVSFRTRENAAALVAAAISSVTALSAEIEGRAYGGGILKTETKEAERLLVPRLQPSEIRQLERSLPRLDALVREGNNQEASSLVDEILGVDRSILQDAQHVLRSRRLGRR
jgi:tRNA1(Val) A37 N6-methylase TrmN6